MKNIRFGLCIPACLFALFCSQQASPQGYVKLNVPYALVGVVNPAVEFAISPKSTLQTDIVISPWKSINEKHMLFAIFMGEYRRYFKEHNRGWYLLFKFYSSPISSTNINAGLPLPQCHAGMLYSGRAAIFT